MKKPKALDTSQISDLPGIIPDWEIENSISLHKCFKFKDFKTGLEFLNIVGDLAETLNHHPDVTLSWSEVKISLTTHTLKGLSELDVELARRIDSSYLKFSSLKG